MSYHINPRSVASYLSGIQAELEPFFPNVRTLCKSNIVARTLRGCKRIRRVEIKRREPILAADLIRVVQSLRDSAQHDDHLFVAQLVIGFCALHRLGELVWADDTRLQSFSTLPPRHKVIWSTDNFSYFLPGHKGDRSFEGNRIVVQKMSGPIDPTAIFRIYLNSRDKMFPGHPFLWVRGDGSIPTRSWFLQRLNSFFPSSIGGHSIRAGGAVALALAGIPPDRIQDVGRWTTETFKIYIRKNPALLHALVSGRPLFDNVFH